jgi:tellurite resistance protein
MQELSRRLTPNFFAIPFGLAGLGVVWRAMAQTYGAPAVIPDVQLTVAAIVWAGLLLATLARGPRQLAAEVRDSVQSPFLALAFIVPIVIAGGIASTDRPLAKAVFIAALIPAALVAGGLTGQWIAGDIDETKAHPGYFLPSVAGGFLSAAVAAEVGLRAVGMLCFGVGFVCWLVLGSVVLNRLFFRSRLPAALIPTLAIEVAPPAIAGSAYFALHGLRADTVTYAIAGYAILMVLVQVRLLPLYLRLTFVPGFWSFTFSWCAVAALALHWIALEHPSPQRPLAWLVCAAVTTLVAAIGIRTGIAAGRGELVPRAAAEPRRSRPGASAPVPAS